MKQGFGYWCSQEPDALVIEHGNQEHRASAGTLDLRCNRPVIIGPGVFLGRADIQKILFPNELLYIGVNAFCGCTSLEEVSTPVSIREIDEHAFSGCSRLRRVDIHGSDAAIRSFAFGNCEKLLSAIVRDGVTFLGGHVFDGCNGLNRLILPSALEHIEDEALSELDGSVFVSAPDDSVALKYLEKNFDSEAIIPYSSGIVQSLLIDIAQDESLGNDALVSDGKGEVR